MLSVSSFSRNTVAFRAQLLKAWLALTRVKYLDNLLVLIPLYQWLALTMPRATQPRSLQLSSASNEDSGFLHRLSKLRYYRYYATDSITALFRIIIIKELCAIWDVKGKIIVVCRMKSHAPVSPVHISSFVLYVKY